MKHASERQLVELAMGHTAEAAALRGHVGECDGCRERLRSLEATLTVLTAWEAPTPNADTWRRMASRVEREAAAPGPRARAWNWARLIPLAGAVAIVVVAGLLARPRRRPAPTAPIASPAVASAGASRVLDQAVADHLDRTQMLLLELEHAGQPGQRGQVDLAVEQEWARELVAANRLYRADAAATDRPEMAQVLDQLEPVLIEISHAPDKVTPDEWRRMQQGIAASGILFKVRVVDQTMQAETLTEARMEPSL